MSPVLPTTTGRLPPPLAAAGPLVVCGRLQPPPASVGHSCRLWSPPTSVSHRQFLLASPAPKSSLRSSATLTHPI
ncbi:hypothetical protein GUJ93_ZPchr0007g4332 [Zizania palustris]|uniref:Uncharacterized protein n=1 Tax=Zizania palustris TaxID=103762 RepID=A0A8J5SVP5_ZIZPA|nr:hypothetical protein GUJ93_ZPchr0007g4332 [Zizania palustris]